MKLYSLTIILSLFFTVGFSQKIIWENDYTKAYEFVKSNNATMLLYFTDGKKTDLERIVKKRVLKSNTLKSLDTDVVIVTVNPSDDEYKERLVLAHNKNQSYPAIKAIKPNDVKSSDLLTSFNETEIASFFNQIKSF